MQEYDKMSFRAADVDVIRRYAESRHWTYVEAMHRIANVLEKVMKENRPVREDDFTMPQMLKATPSAEECGHPVCHPCRQRHLFSMEALRFMKGTVNEHA